MKVIKNPDELVGTPYNKDTFHCWHFIETCLDVPKLDDIAIETAQKDIDKNKPYYVELKTPIDYCLALLCGKHIGIYYNNMIYHADRDMVKCETMRAMQRKYPIITFWDKEN